MSGIILIPFFPLPIRDMKQCPNCKKTYGDDLFYCLDDGVALSAVAPAFDPDARTEVIQPVQDSTPTAVINTDPTEVIPPGGSNMPYVVIAALGIACVLLAAVIVFLVFRLGGSDAQNANAKVLTSATPSPANLQINTSTPITTSPSATPSRSPNSSPSPSSDKPAPELSGRWSGTWSTDSGTLLRIVVTLTNKAGLEYEGTIVWTLVKTVRPDKASKVGLSATEFVRGVFEPDDRTLRLAGYGKDDPDDVLVMTDQYRLNLAPDGKTLNGLARNGGKWNGHVQLTR